MATRGGLRLYVRGSHGSAIIISPRLMTGHNAKRERPKSTVLLHTSLTPANGTNWVEAESDSES